ncbi:hypothetical protein [Ectobacillus funiculus]|uniref:Uncharacterized protein n=1 Tax=Ectobacillus funiculus TaxID=137993 RepID=A0ABV5WGN1_9BACI
MRCSVCDLEMFTPICGCEHSLSEETTKELANRLEIVKEEE